MNKFIIVSLILSFVFFTTHKTINSGISIETIQEESCYAKTIVMENMSCSSDGVVCFVPAIICCQFIDDHSEINLRNYSIYFDLKTPYQFNIKLGIHSNLFKPPKYTTA